MNPIEIAQKNHQYRNSSNQERKISYASFQNSTTDINAPPVKLYVKLTNDFINKIKPDLKLKQIKKIFENVETELPIVFGNNFYDESGKIQLNVIMKNSEQVKDNKIRVIYSGFSYLNKLLLQEYGEINSKTEAINKFNESYIAIKERFSKHKYFEELIKSLPYGVAEEDKIQIIDKQDIQKIFKQKTIDFIENYDKYKALFHYAGYPIFFNDSDYKIVDINPRGCEIFGIDKTDIVGRSLFELGFFYQNYGRKYKEQSIGLLAGDLKSFRDIYKIKADKGSSKILEITSTALLKEGNDSLVINICRDITENILMEETLRESEEKFKSIFNNVNDMIIYVDQFGKIIEVNEKVKAIFGYSQDELIGNEFFGFNFIDLEDLDKIIELFNKAVKIERVEDTTGKEINLIDLEIKKRDGKTGFVEASTSALRKNGELEGFLTIIRDITERKKAEKTIENRLKFESKISKISSNLISTTPDDQDKKINKALKDIGHFVGAVRSSLFILEDNGSIITNTHEWCADPQDSQISMLQNIPRNKFGYYMKFLEKYEIVKICRPDDIPANAESEREWIEENGFRPLIFVPMIHEGILYGTVGFYGEINQEIDWLKETEGQLKILADIFVNTLERNKSIRALRESEERLRSIFNSSPDAITITNLDNIILDCNDQAVNLYGSKSKQEIIGRSSIEFISSTDQQKAQDSMNNVLDSGIEKNLEYTFVREDGSQYPGEQSASLILDACGRHSGFITISKDISHRRKTEDQIKNTLKEKEILLQEIHHRVKNNMQVISSLISLQAKKIEDDETREKFKESQNRIKSMALVHEKMYQSKDFTNINFNEYITSLVTSLFRSYRIYPKKIDLKMDIEDVSLKIDLAIPCGLIINELVSNSLKHAFIDRKSGEIQVKLHTSGENNIKLIVKDNGIGIPEDLDIKNAETLGLQLINLLVENNLRGELKMQRGLGTEFQITFQEADLWKK